MNRQLYKIALLSSLLWAGAHQALLAQQVLDRILAVVDDGVILESEVAQGAYLMAMQMHLDPGKSPQQFERLKNETLTNLINQKVLLVQAEKDTIKADAQQVERYLQQQMQSVIQQLGGEDKVEEYFGAPITKVRRNYREEIERNLRIRTVQSKKMEGITVSRREVQDFYKAYRDSIGPIKESVDISHILITTKPGERATQEAFDKASSIRERLLAGEDFASLAQEYSQDPGSASRGGNLGFMARGEFVRDFEEAAYKLQANEISDVVKTQFGYHIIQMLERRGEKINTRHILITLKPSREDEKAAADTIKAVHNRLTAGAAFEEMVAKYSEDISSKDEAGYLGHFELEQLRERAKEFVYAISGVAENHYTEPVKTQYGFHILRVNAREEPRELSFQKDYESLQRMALDLKMQKEFNEWIDELKQFVHVEIKDETVQ